MSANMLGQLGVALQETGWDNDIQLEVKIAGTLKNDKFIVIKPVKEKLVSKLDPDLKQKHIYQGETK
ncbi:hypothetical protein S-PM2d171 [Synechococcus phage S-PM2]|uniref:Hypothetical-Protein / belonging to T4-LIKE GC: 862 n=1 Tax=Synechococcus phage S-PM2 TaxID=238854 RepID=Q5GQG6_BPSYP|nr:Hypothetical-Protein / belonging to T4-LIKE GC: 862 [Synechococcus phage S-PM2]CAF34236.1 Hypothetical-Protein / belonging to T4-LIKE GC: 862 [Synechococcus phage S-PM2]CFW42376.1 hypothetical protein S-PM2d171 [Synechococcus phage S-PM2]